MALTIPGQARSVHRSRFGLGTLLIGLHVSCLLFAQRGLGQPGVPSRVDLKDQVKIRIEVPDDGLVLAEDRITVRGTVSLDAEVLVNGIPAIVRDNRFAAFDVPLIEGTNTFVATAKGRKGRTASDVVRVRKDTAPPLVVIESPSDGDRLVSEMVTVAGTVNDIIPGATVNRDDVSVTLNGMQAVVNNRTFILADVPLALGDNTLTAIAVDRVGNTNSQTITVTREPDLAGVQVLITGGNAQSAPINGTLVEALSVHLQLANGTALENRALHFTVSRGDGLLGQPQDELQTFSVLSDTNGDASANFTVGSRTGEGFHRVKVTTPGTLTFAEFCATAVPGTASTINMVRMVPRRACVNDRVPEPLAVIVTDAGGNPVPNEAVTFQVTTGGGFFEASGGDSLVVPTNPDGIAEARWTIGPERGVANNEATATFAANLGFPVTFNVSGLVPGAIEDTSISGIVQNSVGRPIAGIPAEIMATGQRAMTGADGRFRFSNVTPGGHHVNILGSDGGNPSVGIFYPDIEFAVTVISGVENQLGQIVILPFLDMGNAKFVGGRSDVVLSMGSVSDFGLRVFANSVILPDDTRGEVLLSSSQVKFDKVPMPPPQGATPFVVGTIQPAGIRFDPPAQVIYPNANGLAPGDVADIFAFHHDIGQFVNVGPGTVSEDGSVVTSDPGFGIIQSGWHCLIRFPGILADCANCLVIQSQTVAAVGNRRRTTLGVCEQVTISAGSNVTWTVSGGGTLSTNAGATTVFTAGDTASTSRVIATFPNTQQCEIRYNVIEPTGISVAVIPGTKRHVQNTASAGFMGRFTLSRTTVSFGRIEIQEQVVNAVTTGSFDVFSGLPHAQGPWAAVGQNNVLGVADNIYSGVLMSPYSVGTFLWAIPVNYRCVGSTGAGRQFTILNHFASVTATGQMTMSKGGGSITCQPSDPTSP